MAKEKTLFACTACGYETSRWVDCTNRKKNRNTSFFV